MELIDQHTKKIMEGCKKRARDAGLRFQDETIEYIVTNRDLLELSPKMMIPTLYNYWVHDVEVLKEKGRYELYPGNPYETVINTRPAISFYNDNNPDWLNVMIFYHVLAHIDFFQNNLFFKHTWDYDFAGQALADKRLIANAKAEKGRWVDYIIEFARSIDNLTGYYHELSKTDRMPATAQSKRLDFYFDIFLQNKKKFKISDYIKKIERYNDCIRQHKEQGEKYFFAEIETQYPEFEALFKKSLSKKSEKKLDLIQFILRHSTFLNADENRWMKPVIQVVRKTSLFFQGQIKTKIINEGWASYWHETLFLQDDRIQGHEVDFARVNSAVTAMPRVGLNPYALGMRLLYYIEELADKGKYDYRFQRLLDAYRRDKYDQKTGKGRDFIFTVRKNFCDFSKGRDFIFTVRKNFCDFMLINTFVDQDFVTRNKLFVAGKRLKKAKMVWEYYIKSRNAEEYRQMLKDTLYHPPHIEIDTTKNDKGSLDLVHHFEGRPLVSEYIANTMLGIEYLWGEKVNLETSEVVSAATPIGPPATDEVKEEDIKWQRVLYTMKDRKLSKKV
ncbi:MAG: SpoVR family protein, partial [Deltaproteobacteria bacterium]|nr:SpoVR family protein [Deltaproteobacteria bacterium]